MGVPQQLFSSIIEAIGSDGALDVLQLPPEIKSLFERLVSQSSFVFEGVLHLASFSKGTPAGTPLADVLFVVIMARIIRCIYQSFHQQGLSYDFPFVPSSLVSQEELHDLKYTSECTYIDDAMFWRPVLPSDNAHLLDMAAKMLAIVSNTFF